MVVWILCGLCRWHDPTTRSSVPTALVAMNVHLDPRIEIRGYKIGHPQADFFKSLPQVTQILLLNNLK